MEEFRRIGKTEMRRRIADACLSAQDAQIAQLRLCERMRFSDIAAECGCDRRTASRHFKAAIDILSNAE